MTDSSPLRNIKTALNKLKKEIGEMDLRIGVVGCFIRCFVSFASLDDDSVPFRYSTS